MKRWKSIVSVIFVLCVTQAAGWADQPIGPVGERTIKAFHFGDFAGGLGQLPRQSVQTLMATDASGCAPLFDGTDSSILAIFRDQHPALDALAWDRLTEHDLTVIDNPPIYDGGAAIVGRWAATQYDLGLKEYVPTMALTLKVDYGGLTPTVAVAHLTDIGDTSTTFQNFRLPIAPPPPTGRIHRLTLSVQALSGVFMILEDVRLVEGSGTASTTPALPPAGLPPADMLPLATQAVQQLDFFGRTDGPFIDGVPVRNDGNGLSFRRRPADGSLRRISVVSMDAPPVAAGDFGVTGTISYSGLEGQGDFDGSAYFELTAFFPDGTSRVVGTTAPFGPCGKITGRSGDRPMQLAMHSAMQPTRLQLQLVADGVGQIGFSNISVVQFQPPTTAATADVPPNSFPWTDQRIIRAAGWSAVLISVLMGILAISFPRFAFVRGAGPILMLGVGEALFAWAMFLIGRREAIAHIAPLFAGAIAWVLPLLARRLVFRRLHEQELRKMLTIDAG